METTKSRNTNAPKVDGLSKFSKSKNVEGRDFFEKNMEPKKGKEIYSTSIVGNHSDNRSDGWHNLLLW